MKKQKTNNVINIVHVNDIFYPYRGGSTFRLLNLLKGINKESFNFNFIILTKNYTKQLPKRERISDNIEIIRFTKYIEIPFLLKKISRERKIDFIHAHNYRPSFFAYIANIFLKKPLIIEMHAIYKTSRLKQIIGKILLKKTQKIIVLSERSKNYLKNIYRIDNDKISIIYNGIDINLFANHKIVPKKIINYKQISNFLSKFRLKIGYIGTLHKWQGVFNFIKIAKEISRENKDIGFLIIGDGPEYSRIEEDVKKFSLCNRILICHAVPHEDVPFIYKKIDILLMPRASTLATETTIPLKPLEAIASGKTMVGSSVGGLIDLQKYFPKNIFLFDSNQKISLFIKNIKKNKLKKEIPQKISYFSSSMQAKKLIRIYNTTHINNQSKNYR